MREPSNQLRPKRSLALALLAFWWLATVASAERLVYVFDTHQRLAFGCCTTEDLSDHVAVIHEPGSDDVTVLDPGLPEPAALDAVALGANGVVYFSIDTTVDLGGGLLMRPGDVVRDDDGVRTKVFDAAAAGLPAGLDVDAFAMLGGDPLPMIVSFGTAAELPTSGGTFVADDEDLVQTDGTTFALFFDGSAEGIDSRRDLDAVHVDAAADALLLGFDGSGTVDGVAFDDHDVLTFDRSTTTWSLRHAMQAVHADLAAGADLVALGRVEALFADGFESGDTSAWTFGVP